MSTRVAILGATGRMGRTLVRAEVPQTELLRYAVDLRAMTSGTATFDRCRTIRMTRTWRPSS